MKRYSKKKKRKKDNKQMVKKRRYTSIETVDIKLGAQSENNMFYLHLLNIA
jgi:hypothetical protein